MRIHLLGVGIDNIQKSDALQLITHRIEKNLYTVVYTPNPIMIRRAMRDADFRRILNRAHLNLADGVGLSIGATLMSLPRPPRVAGIEFGQSLLALAEKKGWRVFLLGAKPGVAQKAAEKLRQKYPHLVVCGTHHGYFKDFESDAVCRAIKMSQPDILLVCLGSPRQERWIAEHRPHGVLVAAALGGSLDVWAGNTRRAPHLVSAVGMEWLWRMCLEPKRFVGLPDMIGFLAATAKCGAKKTLKMRNKL